MIYKDEIWKDIKGYEGLYQVSNFGRVKSLKIFNSINRHPQEKILKQCKNENGYYILNLTNKTRRVHRIVAMNFLENPNNHKCVNHINGIKTDNRVENLEWCTHSYNNKEAYRIGLKKPAVKSGIHYTKKLRYICQYDLKGKFINKFYGTGEIKRAYNYHPTAILSCCKGKQNSAYGSLWSYENEKVQEFNENYKGRNFKNYGNIKSN